MSRIERLFSEADRAAINDAVCAAESRTSAEIVPVVAASSGRYDRSEDIVGLWCAVLALFVVWLVYPVGAANDWSTPLAGWEFVAYAAAVVVGFVVGTVVASRVDGLRKLFTPAEQMRDEVSAKARVAFFDRRVHHTAGSSGVLLFMSLFERRGAIVVDQTVLERLGQPAVDALCAEFVEALHRKNPTAAICETVRRLGDQLAESLPGTADDVNEHPDALVLIG